MTERVAEVLRVEMEVAMEVAMKAAHVVVAAAVAAAEPRAVVGSRAVAGVLAAAAEFEVTGPGREVSGWGRYVFVVQVDSVEAARQLAVAREMQFPECCHLRVPFLVETYIKSNQKRSHSDNSRV